MIKKLIIGGLIAYGIFIAYQKFIAPDSKTLSKRQSSVDLMGATSRIADK